MSTSAPELTGMQKVALVLMHMTQEQAIQVMRQFSEAEAEAITAEIVRLRQVNSSVAEKVLTEFHELSVRGSWRARGGRDVAVGLLEASFGSERAAGLMDRLTSTMSGGAFDFFNTAEPRQVRTLLTGELPQTIALVLAHLRPALSSAVMAELDDALRIDVAQCIGGMGTATPEAVGIVSESLRLRAGAVVTPREFLQVGGVQPLVEILNRTDVAIERALLESLEERDPDLAEEVRSRMLTFADIVKLEQRDVQQVLRGVDPSMLAIAMKGSSDQVIETIRTNLSERNRALLDDEISMMGPVRLSHVEDARSEIVRSIRELESQGAITVHRGEEDEYVY